MATRVNLELAHFDSSLLAPQWSESNPEVWVWLDRNFEREPVKLNLKEDDGNARYSIQVTGESKTVGQIPASAKICFQLFTETHSENGFRCKVDAGTNYIGLAELKAAHKRRQPWQKEIEFKMRTVGNLVKGRLRVRLTGLEMASGCKMVANPLIQAGFGAQQIADKLTGYIQQTIDVAQQLPEASPGTERIRVPAYLGETGFELVQGAPLPAAAYMLYEVPKSNPLFWDNAFKCVMRRHGLHESEFDNLSHADRARCMAGVCCFVAQSCPYVGDHVDRNQRTGRYMKNLQTAIENFGQACVTWSGDCEDLAQAIMTTHESLMQADLSNSSKPLQQIQALAHEYATFMCLDSVTSAAVGMSAQGIGAHMNVFFLPHAYCKAAIARADPEAAARLPFNPAYLRQDLPVLTGEGTGLFESTAVGDQLADFRKSVYGMRSLASFKKPIVHKQGTTSSFYKAALVGFTRNFYRQGSPEMAFWFSSQQGRRGSLARGAEFPELESNSSRIALVPQPTMPQDVMRLCEEGVKVRVPPNNLMLTEARVPPPVEVAEQCQQLQAQIRALGRQPSRPGLPGVSVQLPADMFTAKDVQNIMADVQRNAAIYDFQFHFEPVVDGVSDNLRMEFFADPSTVQWAASESCQQ